jgi:arginyl-tRNA synthetase
MNIYAHYEEKIRTTITELTEAGDLPPGLDCAPLVCEAPRDESHGDLASNAAMVLAKKAKIKPRDLAEKISAKLGDVDGIKDIEIAGPGFINMRLDPLVWVERINDILAAGQDWGKSTIGEGHVVNVEYVSANPTGPLHAAHARGAIIGDAMAALLETAGYTVTREYYINDAGTQVDTLARSAYLRYREALGENIGEIPKESYPGEYLKETGQKFADAHGKTYLGKNEEEWLPVIRAFAIEDIMEGIKTDLTRLGIKMDRFSSERALVDGGAVDKTIAMLEKKGLIYKGVLEPPKGKAPDDWEPREQTLFKATDFGDDIDRPIMKSDGTWTYFASDMAYHMDKLSRGAGRLIDIWGADHGGYVKRMQAAVQALSGQPALDVRLCQLVNLMDKGKPVKMSKRAGTFVTLSDVLDSVGKDILRFIMLTRRNDQSMDFDYAKVTEQSRDNPVFYVQYAHARAQSVLRSAGLKAGDDADLGLLKDEAEISLCKIMATYPRFIESAAEAHEPHRIAFYLNDLAASFHALWNKGRDHPDLKFIVEKDAAVTTARLRMVEATALVIRSGLAMLGVEAVEEM